MSRGEKDSHDMGDQSRFLGENDKIILQTIKDEHLTEFSFDGLKRIVGMHQETLSRTLDRLEEQHMVENTPKGYKVSLNIKRPKIYLLNNPAQSSIPLIQTLLPPDISIQRLLLNLRGKWFGVLRWLGYSKMGDSNNEEITLKWITDDGGIQINAIFLGDTLSIEAKLRKNKELSDAIKASYRLMEHMVKVYSKQGTEL
ncbi:MAG: hypothetical protein WBZ20_09945 [Nitrososphaeraceae archaeon]